jgi:hypothetical protein
MLTNRQQLRRDILRDLGDMRILTATSNGTDVDFRDDVNLNGEPGVFSGREVLFVGGTAANIGEIRYVQNSSQIQRAIGFGVALPTATAVGDEAEMINTRGTGYHFLEVHDAINQAIRSASSRALTPTPVEVASYTRGDSISIPPEFETVEGMEWLDENDDAVWHSIPYAIRSTGRGWWINRNARTVEVNGNINSQIDGRTIRLWGLTAPDPLYSDSDETSVDAEWIAMQARAILSFSRYMRMPTPETERVTFLFEQRAGYLRGKLVTRRSPFSQEI